MTTSSGAYEASDARIEPGSGGERDCLERTGHRLLDDGLCACGKNDGRTAPSADHEASS